MIELLLIALVFALFFSLGAPKKRGGGRQPPNPPPPPPTSKGVPDPPRNSGKIREIPADPDRRHY